MSVTTASPEKAKQLLDSGAILVDIREADEHAREKIPGARHLPLSKLEEMELAVHRGTAIQERRTHPDQRLSASPQGG